MLGKSDAQIVGKWWNMDATYLEKAKEYAILGPHYFEARDIAQAVMDKFEAEHFEPLLKKFSDELYEKAKGDFENWLMSDTTINLQDSVRRMVDDVVNALLAGEQWALERFPLADRYDGDRVRKAIAAHIPVELQAKRIAELEAEVKSLKERLHYAER